MKNTDVSYELNKEVEPRNHNADKITSEVETQISTFINIKTELKEEMEAKELDAFNKQLKICLDTTCEKWELIGLVN